MRVRAKFLRIWALIKPHCIILSMEDIIQFRFVAIWYQYSDSNMTAISSVGKWLEKASILSAFRCSLHDYILRKRFQVYLLGNVFILNFMLAELLTLPVV